MKVFVSHSSKDKELATALSDFLESINPSVEVFCSSQIGSIKVGKDFVNEITENLNNCDAFIPLLSPNYYLSRFCMIELGFAYSLLFESKGVGGNCIYPLCIPPVKKAEALMGTPLAQLQVATIKTEEDIRAFLDSVFEEAECALPSGLNRRIHAFVVDTKRFMLDKSIITSSAKHLVCKSANVPGEDSDYLEYSVNPDGSGYTLNFRAKPFVSTVYPDFLSFVYQYVDKIDLYEPAIYYENSCLKVCVNNYTNSIRKIDIEIKYSDNHHNLDRRTVNLADGPNNIVIPLRELKSEALKQVSEICFVIKPSAYIEDEGMIQIRDFEILLS